MHLSWTETGKSQHDANCELNFSLSAFFFQNERHFLTFYMPKLFVVAMLWFPAVILSTWQRVNELQDPTYNHTVDTSNFYVSNHATTNFSVYQIEFQIVKAFFYIFGIIYLIYLFVLILRAYTELRSMPFFGKTPISIVHPTVQIFLTLQV